ncbi:MAG: hypothetical protein KF729_06715 [Sandaracinaceae bacterium]|nr:hypothetical protein [Sandaracinaceae bacterium]
MSLLEPLRARPGASFTCHRDGLCCTDLHAWGPLDEVEAATLGSIDERVVLLHDGSWVIGKNAEGRCLFSSPEGCRLHAMLGPKGKPKTCQQFPFILVATPTGGRLATEHRCPCRTMGEREPVTPERGRASCDTAFVDRLIASTVALDDDEEVDMATWETIEAPYLRGEATIDEPPLSGGDWAALGRTLLEEPPTTAYERCLRAFGAALLGEPIPPLGETWTEAFDRAEARSAPQDPEAMLTDYLLDQIWSLDWAFHGSWRQARLELSTRREVARRLARALGGRPDRAMAEAISIVEMGSLSDDYTAFVATL